MPERTLQVGVKALLKNPDGKYLLLCRSQEKYPEIREPWDIPGGRIDPGTLLLDNLSREVREETKLSIQGTPRLICAQDILKIPERHVVRLTYRAGISGEPTLCGDHTEYRWVSLEEMRRLQGIDTYLRETLNEIPDA